MMDKAQLMESLRTLGEVEGLAREAYRSLSALFAEDKEFSSFLAQLEDDESLHFNLLGSAESRLAAFEGDLPASEFTVDAATRGNVADPLEECLALIRQGAITKRQAIDYMVQVEFSEWNAVFLYVVSLFQESRRDFQEIAAAVQAHQVRIGRFVDGLPEDLRPERDIRQLPGVWKRRFLVVDDQERVRELLAAVLGMEGRVETAGDGEEALEKQRTTFFDVVVSDVDMPGMDGVAFFEQGVKEDPSLARRFLFCSGSLSLRVKELCQEYGVPFLAKPTPLALLRKTVQGILDHLP